MHPAPPALHTRRCLAACRRRNPAPCPPPPLPPARSLCCLCGTAIAPNPTNMCVNCIRTQVDITEGIQKQVRWQLYVSQRLPERHTLCFLLLGSWLLHQLALFLRICQGVQSPTSPTCRLPSHDRSRCCGARAAAATCSRPSTGSRQTWVRRAGQTWRPLPATAGAADGDRPARLQQQVDCKRRSSRRPGALPLQAEPAGEAAAAPAGAAGRVSCSRAHGTQVPLDIYALAALPPFLQSPRSC